MDIFKVLVIDDEVYWRQQISKNLLEINEIDEVSSAANGQIALAKLQSSQIDLVLIDIHLTDPNSLNIINQIISKFPNVAIVVVCDDYKKDADIIIKGLSLGSIDYVSKTDEKGNNIIDEMPKKLFIPISIVKARKNMLRPSKAPVTEKPMVPKEKPKVKEEAPSIISVLQKQIRPPKIEVVAIGISTGGPKALINFIPDLPKDLGIPIFIVQHMPEHLTSSFAVNLNSKSKLLVKEAEKNEIVTKNTVYIAPGGKHMTISYDRVQKQAVIKLNNNPPVNYVRPSVDVLFESLPKVYKGNILSIIMTGMGCDGFSGTKYLKEFNSYCITQSEETCVVYGMPKCINEANLSNEILPLEEIASRTIQLVKKVI